MIDQLLRDRFRIERFRPGQEEVIRALLDGRQVLAVMPTGAGKSLCFQLPALLLDGLTLVVSPLIALMQDQVAKLSALGIPAARIDSTVAADEQRRLLASLGAEGAPRLLYVAPERFRNERFVEAVARAGVALLAIDEAHCISEWGHDFRPDYARIGEAIERLKPGRVAALTATATPAVREDVVRALGLVDPAVFVRGFDRPNLHFSVEPAAGGAHKEALLAALLEACPGSALVYAASRRGAEQVAGRLLARRIAAAAYHAGMGDGERARVQERFMDGALRVVVATCAFGMGVDKADVRLVVHHELPRSLEAYYQEAGRAGRDGAPARCALLYQRADLRMQERMIDGSYPAPPLIEAVRTVVERDPDLGEGGERLRAHLGERSGAAVASALRILARQGILRDQGGGRFAPADGAPDEIDHRQVARLREAEQRRLARVAAYAGARSCRRRFLLGYFGDPAAEGLGDSGSCAACDACSGAPPPAASDAQQLVARKALSCVARLDGRFGRQRIALVLEGIEAPEVTSIGLERLPTFGALRGLPHGAILDLLAALQEARLIAAPDGGLPTLWLTPEGREVMHDRARAQIRWVEPSARSPRSRRRAPVTEGAGAGPVDAALVERLRRMRRELADRASLPAFCVFHDSTLEQIARVRPLDAAALAGVPGIGPHKLERYGAAVLEAVRGAPATG